MTSIDSPDAVAARQDVRPSEHGEQSPRRRAEAGRAKSALRERLELAAARLREALGRAGVADLSVRIDLSEHQLLIVRAQPAAIVRRIDIDGDEAERLTAAISAGAGLLVDKTL